MQTKCQICGEVIQANGKDKLRMAIFQHNQENHIPKTKYDSVEFDGEYLRMYHKGEEVDAISVFDLIETNMTHLERVNEDEDEDEY